MYRLPSTFQRTWYVLWQFYCMYPTIPKNHVRREHSNNFTSNCNSSSSGRFSDRYSCSREERPAQTCIEAKSSCINEQIHKMGLFLWVAKQVFINHEQTTYRWSPGLATDNTTSTSINILSPSEMQHSNNVNCSGFAIKKKLFINNGLEYSWRAPKSRGETHLRVS